MHDSINVCRWNKRLQKIQDYVKYPAKLEVDTEVGSRAEIYTGSLNYICLFTAGTCNIPFESSYLS